MKYLRKIQIPKLDKKTMLLPGVAALLILINLVVLFAFILPSSKKQPQSQPQNTPPGIQPVLQPLAATNTPIPQPPASASEGLPDLLAGSSVRQGMVVFAMVEEGYSHLFAFSPGDPTLLRLTGNPWDDQTPSIDPSGTKIAYSSKRNGYWDIYILDLVTGGITPVTDTPEYDSSPSWSPDGEKIVFQSYILENMEIVIADLSGKSVETKQITFNGSEEYDPDWSPTQDQIVFISSDGNHPTIWKAILSDNAIQVQPVKLNSGDDPRHPVWSNDGASLAWSSIVENRRTLFTWNFSDPSKEPSIIVEGDYPIWSPDDAVLFSSIPQPNQDYVAAYSLPSGNLVYPVTPTQGKIAGMDWHPNSLPSGLPQWLIEMQSKAISAQYRIAITPPPENLPNRYQLIPLTGINAPNPVLHDLVNESFDAYRERLKLETGWDVLANLEQAYLPLSDISGPDLQENWLYTGRAVSLNYLPMNVDWMFLAREDFGNQTFFRLFVRPLYQDGSMGTPVTIRGWDINARFDNDPAAYEHGGKLSDSYPAGYWVDITDLALRFGWERIPATPNWMTYYQGSRFNQFVKRDGLSWREAMLELYPQEIFITPTAQTPPTQTLTPTVKLFRTKTPTMTFTPSLTPTHRPTWTPIPE